MMSKPLGIYFHIPFCLQKCRYCDFCSFAKRLDLGDAYITAVLTELDHRAKEYGLVGRRVDTVFFGGGTPSLLSPAQISRLLDGAREMFSVAEDAEITLEANPATADGARLAAFRQMGINRLSMGVQSLADAELSVLGRAHSARDALVFFEDARRAGFDNINIDLMYAIPEQTEASLLATLRGVLSLSPEHISAYGLIVEPGTPFYKTYGGVSPVSEDTEADMNALICHTLREAGYLHYEISNFCKPGYECAHNLKYWRCREYAGFGLAAHSYLGGVRFGNGRELATYLRTPTEAIAERERLSVEQLAYERVMLGLRMAEGISCSEFSHEFERDVTENADKALLARLYESGYLVKKEDRLFLSEEGMRVSNSVILALL